MENFLTTLAEINDKINAFIWVKIGLVLLIGTGILMTCCTKWFQISHIGYWWQQTIGGMFRRDSGVHAKTDKKTISQFQALCTALAATIGTGNIAGVAGAIAIGGPGAVFWMWISALLGMVTKYSEVTLAVHYRQKNKHGDWVGGPMYYIQNGLGKKWKWLGVLFAIFGVFAVFGTGNATQVNTIVASIDTALISFGVMEAGSTATLNLILGIVITVLVGMILLGGIKRIGHVAERLVPIMALLYVVLGLGVIIVHIGNLPAAFSSIIKGAFNPTAVTGGVVGAMFTAVQKGVARGIFSNEAGLGSAAISAAASTTDDPARQGYVSMTGTFIDTIIVCTITGLTIASSGVLGTVGPDGKPLTGVALTMAAFSTHLGTAGNWIVSVGIMLFAYSTILGWEYNGEKAWEYLWGTHTYNIIYRLAFSLVVYVGATQTLDLVWNLSDIANALMAVPNLVSMLVLAPVIKEEVLRFEAVIAKEKAGRKAALLEKNEETLHI